ncbi:MAG: hypothetical protein A4E56_01263 [Pelotomaculum sp. PtaU1.Bin065]|nr:MAG: hypothetical protein A4E56_01263 [Pelotomaculum sp. PtaU1.Bin065]
MINNEHGINIKKRSIIIYTVILLIVSSIGIKYVYANNIDMRFRHNYMGSVSDPTDQYYDKTLPALNIISPTPGSTITELQPVIKVQLPVNYSPQDEKIIYQYEIDTTPYFNSPNLVRFPMRYPVNNIDKESAKDIPVHFTFIQERYTNYGPELKLPFRLSLLALPNDFNKLDMKEMVKQSQRLTWGITNDDEIVREIFSYMKHKYLVGTDRKQYSGLDVFKRQIGGCGHYNRLFANFCEFNGISSRMVAVHNELSESILSTGVRHTSTEIFIKGKWHIADPFFDLYLNENVYELNKGNNYNIPVANLKGNKVESLLGETLDAGELYQEPQYFDPWDMNREISSSDLHSGESWPLIKNPRLYRFTELWPKEDVQIWIRVRYLVGQDAELVPVQYKYPNISDLRISKWTVCSFHLDLTSLKKYPDPDISQGLWKFEELFHDVDYPITFKDIGDDLGNGSYSGVTCRYNKGKWIPVDYDDAYNKAKPLFLWRDFSTMRADNEELPLGDVDFGSGWLLTKGNTIGLQEFKIKANTKLGLLSLALSAMGEGEYYYESLSKKFPVEPGEVYSLAVAADSNIETAKDVIRLSDGVNIVTTPLKKGLHDYELKIKVADNASTLQVSLIAANSAGARGPLEVSFYKPLLTKGYYPMLR